LLSAAKLVKKTSSHAEINLTPEKNGYNKHPENKVLSRVIANGYQAGLSFIFCCVALQLKKNCIVQSNITK